MSGDAGAMALDGWVGHFIGIGLASDDGHVLRSYLRVFLSLFSCCCRGSKAHVLPRAGKQVLSKISKSALGWAETMQSIWRFQSFLTDLILAVTLPPKGRL